MEEGEKAFMVRSIHRDVFEGAFHKSKLLQVCIFHEFAALLGQCYEKVLLEEGKIELNGYWC